jgi:hypothetical protein
VESALPVRFAKGVQPGGMYVDEFGEPHLVQRSFANPNVGGQSSLVAAVGGSIIRVLSYSIVTNGVVGIKFQSNNTDISATLFFASNGGIAIPSNPHGEFQTAVGEALNVNLNSAVAAGINFTYVLI